MGKKKRILKLAYGLGLSQLKPIILYAQPKEISHFGSSEPQLIYTIKDYLHSLDPSLMFTRAGFTVHTFYYLAPSPQIYVELVNKLDGMNESKISNHVIQMNIYSNNIQHVQTIIKIVNNVWENGMLENINWKKMKNKFHVNKEMITESWEKALIFMEQGSEVKVEEADDTFLKRSERFKTIIRSYNAIPTEKLAKMLWFDDPFDLEAWLLDVFSSSPLKIVEDKVYFHSEGSEEEIEKQVESRLQQFREWEEKQIS